MPLKSGFCVFNQLFRAYTGQLFSVEADEWKTFTLDLLFRIGEPVFGCDNLWYFFFMFPCEKRLFFSYCQKGTPPISGSLGVICKSGLGCLLCYEMVMPRIKFKFTTCPLSIRGRWWKSLATGNLVCLLTRLILKSYFFFWRNSFVISTAEPALGA